MKNRKTIINLDNLPYRSEKLSSNKIETVFGGCKHFQEECQKPSDCCGHLCPIIISKGYCLGDPTA